MLYFSSSFTFQYQREHVAFHVVSPLGQYMLLLSDIDPHSGNSGILPCYFPIVILFLILCLGKCHYHLLFPGGHNKISVLSNTFDVVVN